MKKIIYILVLGTILSSCYPGGAEYVDELDVVYSNYAKEYDFNSYMTYSLPDGVIEVKGPYDGGQISYIDDVYSDVILNKLRENLNAYGWTEVEDEDDADVIMLASWASNTNYYYYDPGYWGGYYPGYSNWYYPGYYPTVVGSYTTGTILIQMTDPAGASVEEDEIPVIWTASVNGLLEGSQANVTARLKSSLDQAFLQSSYLDKEN